MDETTAREHLRTWLGTHADVEAWRATPFADAWLFTRAGSRRNHARCLVRGERVVSFVIANETPAEAYERAGAPLVTSGEQAIERVRPLCADDEMRAYPFSAGWLVARPHDCQGKPVPGRSVFLVGHDGTVAEAASGLMPSQADEAYASITRVFAGRPSQ